MKTKDPIKVKKGKKSKAAGARFELRVRKYLEEKGWIIDKWSNNIEFEFHKHLLTEIGEKLAKDLNNSGFATPDAEIQKVGKLVKVKNKFRGKGIPMMLGAGFPDFIAYKRHGGFRYYEVIGVESKMNGILDKEEKEKCKWYLKNNIFSEILVASKSDKRGQIKLTEFKN